MGRDHYASISSGKDRRIAKAIDRVVAKAPKTAEIFGVTTNGAAYVRIDDEKNNVLAYAALEMTGKWRTFLNDRYREDAKYEKSIKLDERDEFLGSPRVDEPTPRWYFAPGFEPSD